MNRLKVCIYSVQHIRLFEYQIDIRENRLHGIAGRNGCGKTTLIRALRNVASSDTFIKTAGPQIFGPDSKIAYEGDDFKFEFTFDSRIRSLNCRDSIPKTLRQSITAELPMPHGARFNFFRSASDASSEIRQALIIGSHTRPEELIDFLSSIYGTNKFDNLVEISVKGTTFYCIPLPGERYIREDHLSSGEYFLINLYRTIKGAARLIAIDEIELSLDSAAQSQLMMWLRSFCSRYGCSLIFTTHSLAIMRTLEPDELSYMEDNRGEVFCYRASYSFVKSRLFGFKGCDKYILTEDIVLNAFIEHLVRKFCGPTFFTYRVVHIGGYKEVVSLLKRNAEEHYFGRPQDVIAVLDGDSRTAIGEESRSIRFLPFDSVEKAILYHYNDSDFPYRLPIARVFTGAKDAFNSIQQQRVATQAQLFDYVCLKYGESLQALALEMNGFLGL